MRYPIFLFLALFIFISCQDDEEPMTPPIATDTTVVDSAVVAIDLKGYVQKGPFINGSAITLSELDSKLVATGKNFTTQLADNRGSFSLKDIELKSEFVQLQAGGFYFDEVKGQKSAAQLTLFALADVSNASSVNVNLLSHLERNRVVYLMQEEEIDFPPAKQQAQQEILSAFGIATDSIGYSEQLDISQDGDQNAVLLAISAVLQGNNSVADLSELLGNLITDLREDGTVNSEAIQIKLKEQAKTLDLPQIRQNLEVRYTEMGVEATIPNFEQYIDSDGDGILNKDEDDTPEDFSFETQKDVAVNDTITSNAVTIAGLKEGGIAVASVTNSWFVVNDNVLPDTTTEVKNGDKVQIQLVSSDQFADTTTASVTIGTSVETFKVVTDDYLPNALSFTSLIDVAVDSLYTSDTVTISGLPYPTPITVTNGILIKNGKIASGDSVTVQNGDQLALQLRSSTEYAAASQTILVINGVMAAFETTTDDYAPDDFSFDRIENIKINSLTNTDTITITGLPYPTPISLTKGTLSINNEIVDSHSATVIEGNRISIRLQSSSVFDEIIASRLTIGSSEYLIEVKSERNPWQRKADLPENTGYGVTGFSVNDMIYVGLGKDNDNTNVRSFYQYDPSTDQWSGIAPFPGNARTGATGFSINGLGYVGLGNSSQFYNDFWKYDPTHDSWSQIASFPGEPRSAAVSFVIGNYAYVGTGTAYSPNEKMFNDFWRYDPNTDSWTQIASLGTYGIAFAISFASSTKGYVGTGYTGAESNTKFNPVNDFWEYNPNTDEWFERKKLRSGGEGGVVLYVNERGYTNIDVSESSYYYYDLNADEWIDSNYKEHLHIDEEPLLGLSTASKGYLITYYRDWSIEKQRSVYQFRLYEFSPLP